MSTLSERLHRGAASAPSQVDHARRLGAAWQPPAPLALRLPTRGAPAGRLVADWRLLADLAFADLTLWVPLPTGAWWCVAQVRPLTAPTRRPEDLVGAGGGGAGAAPLPRAHPPRGPRGGGGGRRRRRARRRRAPRGPSGHGGGTGLVGRGPAATGGDP